MLTPQEVSNHAFAKAVMGGYNMAMVDEFLDELTDDYTSLYKENAALKAKMKVLVDKVEEYRSTEDAMRAALLTAQKMKGVAVVYVGEDLDVLLELCDRIVVLCGGQVSGVVDARTTDKHQVGALMTLVNKGGKADE